MRRCSRALPGGVKARQPFEEWGTQIFAWLLDAGASTSAGLPAATDIIRNLKRTAHPLDDAARAFYARWGLVDLPFDPRRAMIVRMADLERSGLAL